MTMIIIIIIIVIIVTILYFQHCFHFSLSLFGWNTFYSNDKFSHKHYFGFFFVFFFLLIHSSMLNPLFFLLEIFIHFSCLLLFLSIFFLDYFQSSFKLLLWSFHCLIHSIFKIVFYLSDHHTIFPFVPFDAWSIHIVCVIGRWHLLKRKFYKSPCVLE